MGFDAGALEHVVIEEVEVEEVEATFATLESTELPVLCSVELTEPEPGFFSILRRFTIISGFGTLGVFFPSLLLQPNQIF